MTPVAGQTIELTYPLLNDINVSSIYVPRLLCVQAVRDLVRQPLTVDEFLRRPMLARSRILIEAMDIELAKCRKFYLGVAREHQRPGMLRVALYQCDGDRPVDLVSRPFGPTPLERRSLAGVLCRWQGIELGSLQLRVIADDFGLVT